MDEQEGPETPDEASPETPFADLGSKLKLARKEAGMHQSTVCEKLGLKVRSLTRWEGGETDPGLVRCRQLAELYGVSLDWLAGRTETRRLFRPGNVLIDETVVRLVEQLVEKGRRLEDVPQQMLRPPGLDYAWVIPSELLVMDAEAAMAVESQMRKWIEQLRKKR